MKRLFDGGEKTLQTNVTMTATDDLTLWLLMELIVVINII